MEERTKTFSVKVPTWAWQLLNIIAESREHGSNGNDLLKKCLMFVIETAKLSGPVPVEFRVLLDMLKLDTSWHNAFNFADAGATMDIAQIVLVLQQRNDDGTPRKGFGLAMVDKPFMGHSTINYCVDDIFERITEVSMPGIYRDIRQVGLKLGCESVRETLSIMCDAQLIESLNEEFNDELPKMGNYSDFGKAIEYAQKRKSTQHRTPDGEAIRQQRIKFNEYDASTTDSHPMSYGEKADRYLADLEVRARKESESNPLGDIKPFDVEP